MVRLANAQTMEAYARVSDWIADKIDVWSDCWNSKSVT